MSKTIQPKKRLKQNDKLRRRPAGNKFLSEYYKLRSEILNEGTIDNYTYEGEEEEHYETWHPTKKRLLYKIFDVFGNKVITKEDKDRLERISNNKIRILHNQILSRNLMLIFDDLMRTAVSIRPFSQEIIRRGFPWSIMTRKEVEYFEKDMSNNDVIVVAKKYCRLSKILKRIPRVIEFESVTKFVRGQIYKIMKDENFAKNVTEIFNSWVKIKKNTNKDTKLLATELNNEFLSKYKSGYVTDYDNTNYKKIRLDINGNKLEARKSYHKLSTDPDFTHSFENDTRDYESSNETSSEDESTTDSNFAENVSVNPHGSRPVDDIEMKKLKKALEERKAKMEILAQEIDIIENKINNSI